MSLWVILVYLYAKLSKLTWVPVQAFDANNTNLIPVKIDSKSY